MLSAAQLRLAIGDAAFDAIPDAPSYAPAPRKPRLPRRPRQRSPRNQARQRIVLGGSVPAKIAAGFTTAEVAALCVLAAEHQRRGFCDLTIGEIARRAGCCRTVAQNAIAWAERWQLITVERRRVARDRNAPNLIRICAPVWLAWLRLGPARPRPWGGGGFISATGEDLIQKQVRGSADQKGRERPRNGAWRVIRGGGR